MCYHRSKFVEPLDSACSSLEPRRRPTWMPKVTGRVRVELAGPPVRSYRAECPDRITDLAILTTRLDFPRAVTPRCCTILTVRQRWRFEAQQRYAPDLQENSAFGRIVEDARLMSLQKTLCRQHPLHWHIDHSQAWTVTSTRPSASCSNYRPEESLWTIL